MAEGLPGSLRNSSELRGLCRRSYFGPRTCGRGITIFHRSVRGSQTGFPDRLLCDFGGNVIVYGGHKPIQGDECRPRRRSLSMTRSYPEPLRVTGPLLSLVLRTEDVWQRNNHFFIEVCGALSLCVCVFYYCRTYYKAVRVGGGGESRTCAVRDDEPRPVWTSLPITH